VSPFLVEAETVGTRRGAWRRYKLFFVVGAAVLATPLAIVLGGGCPDQSDETAAAFFEIKLGPTPKADEPPTALYLGSHECWEMRTARTNGLLRREIMRQAFLLAARDEFGLTTLDETVRADFTGNTHDLKTLERRPDVLALDVAVRAADGHPGEVLLYDGRVDLSLDELSLDQKRKRWLTQYQQPVVPGQVREAVDLEARKPRPFRRVPFVVKHEPDYPLLVEQAEAFSRGEFVDILKEIGVEGRRVTEPTDPTTAEVPDDVEDLLGQMNFIVQFAAARRIHAALHESGESAILLGALVRAYANLGILTEVYWSPLHKVFKARALLYSQRMVARDPTSPWAAWHRAYALALAGLHADASNELDEAARLAQEHDAAGPVPSWVSVIDACCRFDWKKLAAIGDTDAADSELALLLYLLAIEPSYADVLTLEVARSTTERLPHCFRAWEVLAELDVRTPEGQSTLDAPAAFARVLPSLTAHIEWPTDVSPDTKDIWLERGLAAMEAQAALPFEPWDADGRAELIEGVRRLERRLPTPREGGRRIEPSFTTLADMMQQVTFLHLFRRAQFLRQQDDEAVVDFLKANVDTLREHPFREILPAVRSSLANPAQSSPYTEPLDRLTLRVSRPPPWRDVSLRSHDLIRDLWPDNGTAYRVGREHASYAPFTQSDEVNFDLKIRYDTGPERYHKLKAHEWYRASPYNPGAMNALIWNDWPYARERLDDWLALHGDYYTLWSALANHYRKAKNYTRAEECLRRAIAISPDGWCFGHLAEMALAQGDPDRARAAVEEHLSIPDPFGSNHIQAATWMATHFMEKKDWQAALPFATRAAESDSADALMTLVHCHEGLEAWTEAEVVARRLSERHPDQCAYWFLWCSRTGHGDYGAAREHAQRRSYYGSFERWFVAKATLELFAGRNAEAVKLYRRAYDRDKAPIAGFRTALLADEYGQTKARREVFWSLTGQRNLAWHGDHPDWYAMARALREYYRQLEVEGVEYKPLDSELIKKIHAAGRDDSTDDMAYIIGQFFRLSGEDYVARLYLTRCAESLRADPVNRALAAHALRTPFEPDSESVPIRD
jgi:tetratricopeptide (TPR) repeat protein